MEPDTTHTTEAVIRCGQIELVQRQDTLLIRYLGKLQTVEMQASQAALEKWALRQLRAEVFAS